MTVVTAFQAAVGVALGHRLHTTATILGLLQDNGFEAVGDDDLGYQIIIGNFDGDGLFHRDDGLAAFAKVGSQLING